MADRMRVLSIDGGGIRGLIPALFLTELEKRAGRPVAELFDFVAGTSTGGILGLGLTCPDPDDLGRPKFSAAEMVELYDEHGHEIFSRSFFRKMPGAELFDERYSARALEKLLKRYFGSARLRDQLVDVMVPAYDIERRTAVFFKSWKAKEESDRDFSLRDVARATSAAPTYFEPYKIEVQGDYYSLVDGGVFANNPAMCALAEAYKRVQKGGELDVVLVSLGTGELTRRIPHDEATGFGLTMWARPIISVMMDGVADSVCYQCDEVLGDRHFRFQVRLDEGSDDMDDASATNRRVLRLLADRLLSECSDEIDQMLELL
jgi:patatin-like phospholipase/acyl hydrolase